MGTVAADRSCFSAVAFGRRHELDPAVAVLVVLPVHKPAHTLGDALLTGESPSGIVRSIFGRV